MAVESVVKVRNHAIFPRDWCDSKLCPLLKKEPADLPNNWRAVALLSHARKIIEKVIDGRIRKQVKFHEAQCGFRGFRSVETAILRVVRAVTNGCKYICVLDLKQAYASVPRGDLLQRIEQRVDANLAKMIESMVYKTMVSTVGDEDNLVREMERGVPEGSPLSPALFNLFIDLLASEIETAVDGAFENALNLFADDIILMSPTATWMQRLLSICEAFAEESGLKWGLNKCHALRAAGAPNVTLLLDGSTLSYASSAEYLGVDLDAQGVTDAATLERICRAGARLRQLKAAGVSRPRLGGAQLRRVYGALVRPVWRYAIHLAPFSDRIERQAADLMHQVVDWIFPKLPKHSKRRAKRLLALEDADVRRFLQILSMRGRMENAHLMAQATGNAQEVMATSQDAAMAR